MHKLNNYVDSTYGQSQQAFSTYRGVTSAIFPTSQTVLSDCNPTEITDRECSLKRLTRRELQCLQYIVKGYSSKEIARKLSLSFRTVENYAERIKTKLGCARKQDLIFNYSTLFD